MRTQQEELEACNEALREIVMLCSASDPSDGEGTSPEECVVIVKGFLSTPPDNGKTIEEGMTTDPKQPELLDIIEAFQFVLNICNSTKHKDPVGDIRHFVSNHVLKQLTRNEVKPCATISEFQLSNSPETFKPESGDEFEKWWNSNARQSTYIGLKQYVAEIIWNACAASKTANDAICIHHNDKQRAGVKGKCLVCQHAEIDQIRKERDDANDAANAISNDLTHIGNERDELFTIKSELADKFDALTLANEQLVKDKERLEKELEQAG